MIELMTILVLIEADVSKPFSSDRKQTKQDL